MKPKPKPKPMEYRAHKGAPVIRAGDHVCIKGRSFVVASIGRAVSGRIIFYNADKTSKWDALIVEPGQAATVLRKA